MNKFILCITSIDDKSSAKAIAKELLRQELVACVNISSPVTSLYQWQGQLEESQEYLLLMKTTANQFKQLEQVLLELHPYEIPEFICLDINDGNKNYLKWVEEQVQ